MGLIRRWEEFECALDELPWGGKLAFIGILCVIIVVLGLGIWRSSVAPVARLPEAHLVIRPIWRSEDTIPGDLYRRSAPAIIIDPDDYHQKKILAILGAAGPGEYDPKKISDFGEQLMAWGDKARPPLWFQPCTSTELLPGRWSDWFYYDCDRKLFQRWFEEADLILVEET